METIQELSFEQAYSQLEEVISKLESGNMSLEDSMGLFERGKKLSAYCQQLLNQAELKIQQLNDEGKLEAMGGL